MSENKEMRRIKPIITIIYMLSLLLVTFSVSGQTSKAVDEIRRGDDLRMKYRFEEALDSYESASEAFVDSLMTLDDSLLKIDVSDRILMAENGLSMMDYVYVPEVIARHKFSVEDFFLYYPLTDGSWRPVPCQLDSTVHKFSKSAFVPDGCQEIFWSKEDKTGVRNIYRSEYRDTIWSVPSLLNEHLTSASDEIYPMLSHDGRKLFFSSEGLYGVGGYDLYVSEYDPDTGEWSVPVNMGFPYSSPYDDFLYIDTQDNEYSLFASNRDCSSDSVWVYVMKYDDMPVRRPVTDIEELVSIFRLEPSASDNEAHSDDVKADIPENIDTRRYMAKMSEVRVLNDSISRVGTWMEEARLRYEQSSDDRERAELADDIFQCELLLPQLQDSLSRAGSALQEIELEFLFSGVVIDPDKLMAEADREMVGHTEDYVFTKRNIGAPLDLKMEEPEPEFDYSFKVLEEGQFAEDNTLPEGLVYQIQMFSTTSKTSVSKLKGLSPVFESKTSNGRYVYRVGLFRTYADVLSNLNTVKKVGFRNAFIVAFNNGVELTVAKAKVVETENRKPSLYEVRINTGKDELDMLISGGIRQQAPGKDIARIENEDGTKVFVVGPFADRNSAEGLAGFVRAMGESGTECVELPQK